MSPFVKPHSSLLEVVPYLLGILAVLALLALAFASRDDGMARCQLTHSFDVCHDSLH